MLVIYDNIMHGSVEISLTTISHIINNVPLCIWQYLGRLLLTMKQEKKLKYEEWVDGIVETFLTTTNYIINNFTICIWKYLGRLLQIMKYKYK